MNTTKHAVLSQSGLLWIEGAGFHREIVPAPCYTLANLAEIAYPHRITHLWVTPDYGIFEAEKRFEGWNFSPYRNRRGYMMGAVVRKTGHREKDLELIFPQHTAWYGTEKVPGWIRNAGAHDILITLRYLEQALGVIVGSSPGRTGWNYLKKIHPEWIEDIPDIDWKATHFVGGAAPDIIWQRPLRATEQGKRYVHKFDKNAAYPYAGTQTDIGVGTPLHVEHGDDSIHAKGHPQAVGVWRCTVRYWQPALIKYMTPALNEDRREGETNAWLSGPIIRLLRSQGHEVTIHEGNIFPDRKDVLVKWGNDFWAIRQSFAASTRWKSEKGAALAYQAVKQIMNSMIGMTAFRGFDEDEEMRRPDIRIQVIARHHELTWHNIYKVCQVHGDTPIIVYMDAVYYMSNEADGRKAFSELVKREREMGGYKYEGRIEMTSDVLEMFSEQMNEAGRLEFLNAKGWIK